MLLVLFGLLVLQFGWSLKIPSHQMYANLLGAHKGAPSIEAGKTKSYDQVLWTNLKIDPCFGTLYKVLTCLRAPPFSPTGSTWAV